ncbi:MAG: 4-(cytidine 5'-diphospho)-2-C-methyl-D-erythritol kinase [Ignavibacteriaceae bacterium]|nr:4-(cytidine 5'-diphospho)-2-C-methyl-D-erythritol kinase [Ignavibacteriaceae bacterium]
MENLEIKSPCKINLGLNILRKREDGYHDIETIFYPLDFFDTIYFEKSDHTSFDSNSNGLINQKSNLILDAKTALESYVGNTLNVKIRLDKRVMIGAGLGGGSSNAAFTLKALNQLYDLNLSDSALLNIASGIGSDVAFFIYSKPAFAISRGEKLEFIDLKIESPILIVNPGIHISTKWAYQNISPSIPKENLKDIIRIHSNDIKSWKGKITNDFEQVVFKAHPEIEGIKNKLYDLGASFSLMSGSGSTVYGIFEDSEAAANSEIYFKEKYYTFLQGF